MKPLGAPRFRPVLVVAVAKSSGFPSAKSGETYEISGAFKDFGWNDFTVRNQILNTTFMGDSP